MFKNVLVGVDGRPGGRDAIALARLLSDPAGKLTLALRARQPTRRGRRGLRGAARAGTRALPTSRRSSSAVLAISPGRGLHEQAERAGRRSTRGRLLQPRHLRSRDARRRHPRRAQRRSLRGRGRLTRLRRAPHGDLRASASPTTSSPESNAALAVARELAAPNGANGARAGSRLDAVQSPTPASSRPRSGTHRRSMLAGSNDRMKELPVSTGDAVYGIAGEELAAFGDELDLLVVGSRGYGPVRRLVSAAPPTTWSATRAARCSCCPARPPPRPRTPRRRRAPEQSATHSLAAAAQAIPSWRDERPRRNAAPRTPAASENASARDDPHRPRRRPRRRAQRAADAARQRRRTSRSSPRPATSKAPGATYAAITRACSCST